MSAKRAKSVKLRIKGRRTIHEDNIIKKNNGMNIGGIECTSYRAIAMDMEGEKNTLNL